MALTILEACGRLGLHCPVSHADLVRVVVQLEGAGVRTNCSALPWWREYIAEGRELLGGS